MSFNKNKVEILAPAGSYDILMADFAAGADAVYLGGEMFGARAYAANFKEEELLRALEYAHIHDKKIYLTVNTLMKQRELEDRLIPYLKPFYEAGLSAVIVQDFGAMQVIKREFPGLCIHASTQMTVTGARGAKLLEEAGASRIVTARELSLAEIKEIRDLCDVEIESFVHGALCYCYSGQCLLSSFQGGRSGNRGRCAQPCRLLYTPESENKCLEHGKDRGKGEGAAYLLSPKDMCGLPILPDIIEAGVYSLKIEGRMKNVNYAAGVTGIYRKYVDRYLEYGKKGYKVSESDINDLMDLYNRGAFTTGYYNNTKGREMISMYRPNHMGTKALKVVKNDGGRVTFEPLEQIYPQDVFEIDKQNSFESGDSYLPGSRFTVNLPRRYRLEKGKVLFRMKNGELTRYVADNYTDKQLKRKISVKLKAVVGEPLELTFVDLTTACRAVVTGHEVQSAQKQPAQKERLAEIVTALGDTDFKADEVFVDLHGDVFVPVSSLKELKRRCTQALKDDILSQYQRQMPDMKSTNDSLLQQKCPVDLFGKNEIAKNEIAKNELQSGYLPDISHITVLVSTKKQAECASMISDVTDIYYDFGMFMGAAARQNVKWATDCCHEAEKTPILALPHILRGKNTEKIKNIAKEWIAAGADTFLVRNLEELGMLSRLAAECEMKTTIKIIADSCMYTWNTQAVDFISELCSHTEKMELIRTTAPLELTYKEFEQSDNDLQPREIIVYTHIPLMVSEQCVKKTLGKCDGAGGQITIGNQKRKYRVQSVCNLCYSILYDDKAYDISDEVKFIEKSVPYSIRYEFTDDTVSDITSVINGIKNDEKAGRGHFELGVE